MTGTAASTGTYARIYAVVRRIPKGRVATYGQVATLAGLGGHARQVGYALSALPDDDPLHWCVPWHRVINARGEISLRQEPGSDLVQRRALEAEGVQFSGGGRVSLERYRWRPRTPAPPGAEPLKTDRARTTRTGSRRSTPLLRAPGKAQSGA